jgi:glycosyltransferase involved in cell wall biosynthesis
VEVKRRLHLLGAGLHLWREQGTAVLIRRYLLRRGPAVPRLSRFRIFLTSLWPRAVPVSRDPEVSIILPGNDRRSLASIIHSVRDTKYEVAESAAKASGRFLLLLRRDILLATGCVEALLDVFARRPGCGAAGAKVLRPNGRLESAGGIIGSDGTTSNLGEGGDPNRPEYNYVREVDFCTGALLVPREVFVESEVESEHEIDLCLELRRRGRTVWYQPAAHVYHFGKKERPPQPTVRACDRSLDPAVLVIDHQVPMSDRDAGSLFMTRFLQTVAASGYHVVFWPDNLLRGKYGAALQQEGIEVVYGPLSFEHFVQTYGRTFSFAVVCRATMAGKYMPALRRAGIPAGYIAVDLEHVREERRTQDQRQVEAQKERERTIVQAAACIGVHSPVEAQLLRDELAVDAVVELPLPLTQPREDSPGVEGRSGLLFLGSTHQPNVDAIRHFAEQLLPRVRERLGDVRLNIAGDVCAAVRDLGGSRSLRLLGHVDDLSHCFDESRVFVAPMRFGAGIKGKILEAMNHGIPVVTTPIGAEGIGLVHGETAMIAENDDAFVDHVVELYSNAELWRRIHLASRRFVQETSSERAFRDAVDRFLSCLGKQAATQSRSEKQGASGGV